MNTQPTPISDRIVSQFRKGEAHSDGLILTMVNLENQLTAALAEIDRLDVAGIHTCHSECQKSNCVLRRELTAVTEQRDGLLEQQEQWRLSSVCRKLNEQRDRLAEALLMITTFDYSDLQCDNGHGPIFVAAEALQSLTPNSQDQARP